DGRRPEVERLARELGAHYIARPSNEHATAGNLNYAMKKTSGSLIAVLDADGVPRKDFLTRLAGYFEDPSVALVQVPQTFDNLDSFQHENSEDGSAIWHEQALFFDVLQRGRDYHGAAMCCGSGSIMSRTALDAIGGIAIGTVTEDLHTTLRLHAAGYRTVYHAEALAYCLAPAQAEAFIVQRARWALGAIQTARKEIWTLIGPSRLSLVQRFMYLPFYYLTAPQRLLYVLAPLLYLAFGVSPVAGPEEYVLLTLVYGACSLTTYFILGRGLARVTQMEIFFLFNLTSYLKAAIIGLLPVRVSFKVTSKSASGGRTAAIVAAMQTILFLSVFAFAFGLMELFAGQASPGNVLSIFCALYFAIVSFMGSIRVAKGAFWKEAYTFFDSRPVRLSEIEGAPVVGIQLGIASAISEKRLRFHQAQPLPVGAHVQVEVELADATMRARCEVVDCRPSALGDRELSEIDLSYVDFGPEQRIQLLHYFFEDATPRLMSTHGPLSASWLARREGKLERRQHERLAIAQRVWISSPETDVGGELSPERLGLMIDVSRGGALVRNPEAVEPGSKVQVWVPWLKRRIEASVVRCQPIEGAEGDLAYELGVAFHSLLDAKAGLLAGARPLALMLESA
ncbi:MAG TPA: glycosyltransferase family 2 protein, partial [Bdellovibrionota bacterium]|nr:glycosyltransferase family 2 protein [Bdellovibrionota bacterium]